MHVIQMKCFSDTVDESGIRRTLYFTQFQETETD